MSGLNPRARALLGSARLADKPSRQDRAKAKAAFAERVGAGVFLATTDVAALQAAKLTAAGASAGMWSSGVLKTLVAIAVIGALGGGAYVAERRHLQARQGPVAQSVVPPVPIAPTASAVEDRPAPAPPVTSTAADAKILPIPAATPGPARPVIAPPRATKQAARDEAPHDFQEELALIGDAQRALQAGDPARALAIADEHAARFPKGQLAAERSGIRVLAACALGSSGAKASAERFLRAQPASPIAGRVRSACGL
jgi:hypothetical protein